ncbi:conserved hypothetical protein, partial [Trichinella spiralis]|uniref:hypothetical protein n=1 Tax=Trichinella spiralis TaxID=6334 RepID=UPI0001EFBC86
MRLGFCHRRISLSAPTSKVHEVKCFNTASIVDISELIFLICRMSRFISNQTFSVSTFKLFFPVALTIVDVMIQFPIAYSRRHYILNYGRDHTMNKIQTNIQQLLHSYYTNLFIRRFVLMSEDDDPVIKEIDVYLKKDDSNLFYLLQGDIFFISLNKLPNCHYLENMKPTAFNFSPSSEQIELLMSANDVSQSNFDVAPGSSLRHTRMYYGEYSMHIVVKSEYFLQAGCAVNPSSLNNLAVGYPTE